LGVGDYLVNNGIQDLFDRALFKEDGLLKVEKLRMLETKYDATPATSVFVTDTVGDVLEGQGGKNDGNQKKVKPKERVIVTAGTRTCRTCDFGK
jgi:hypothetical protein